MKDVDDPFMPLRARERAVRADAEGGSFPPNVQRWWTLT